MPAARRKCPTISATCGVGGCFSAGRFHQHQSAARYAYSWRGDEDNNVEYIRQVPNEHRRPNVTITEEENRIVLDFDKFTMTIQAKG
jgi:hypothetical protein